MPDTAPVVVGIDLGTSAVKVLAVTIGGLEVATGSEFYGLETPQPGYVEQNADVVYRATMRVLARVLADVRMRGDDVAAIGLSSAMHGVLAVDAQGEPVSSVITWMDRRANTVAEGWRRDGTAARLYERTGAPMHPMLPLAKLAWVREHDTALFAAAARFVGLKELVVHRWTGEWVVDHGIASATGMLDLRTRDWDAAALELAGVGRERLSTPAPPSTALRAFRPAIARELGLGVNTAVVLASADGPLANIGSGAGECREVALTLGTSGAVRVLSNAPLLDAHQRTFCYCADDRRYVVGGPTSSAGASLDWVFALLLDEIPKDQRFGRAVSLAEERPPGSDGVTVLPFFAGERAPYWRADLRGLLAGLDLSHDRRSLLRASLEGVVFGVASVYAVVRELAPGTQRLLLSGGLTKSPLVRGLLADIFEVPAVQPHQREASAFGAALLAAESVGLIDDAVARAAETGYDEPTQPNPANREAYAAAFERYRCAVEAIT